MITEWIQTMIDRSAERFLERVQGSKQESAVRKWTGLANLGQDVQPIVIPVTEENAMKVPVFFGAVKVLSETVAMLPMITYKRLPGDERRRATEVEEYRLFKEAINPRVTSYEWRESMIRKAIMKGNSFTRLFWDLDRTKVYAMQFLDHERHEIRGEIALIWLKNALSPLEIPRSDLIHFKWTIENSVEGRGIIDFAPGALGFLIAAERYGMSFFANGAVPYVILTHPGELGPIGIDEVRRQYKEQMKNKGHEPFVAQEGMKVDVINVPNEQSQFLQLRSFQLQEVARFLRVTPHKLQDLERATFSNVVELNRAFVLDSIMPLTRNLESRIQLDVFPRRDDLYVEFMFDDLLTGDTNTRYEAYRLGIQSRFITVDEVRKKENMNALSDEQIEKMDRVMKGVNQGGNNNDTNPNTATGREAAATQGE